MMARNRIQIELDRANLLAFKAQALPDVGAWPSNDLTEESAEAMTDAERAAASAAEWRLIDERRKTVPGGIHLREMSPPSSPPGTFTVCLKFFDTMRSDGWEIQRVISTSHEDETTCVDCLQVIAFARAQERARRGLR